ncbi:MAG: hypothetical protein K2X25_11630 [Caulobacteraceae bacterium]|nr:hypothetical protein [Caulobacteraceae bacterium]
MTTQARHIRLELAREPGHPQGDADTGYDIVAFLDDTGRLNLETCRAEVARCRVRRFVDGQTAAVGQLRHTTGDRWLLDFPDDAQDATGFHLGDETFVTGEYVSMIDHDGTAHTYVVKRVEEI